MFKVTIIITCYNKEKYIEECIESALCQNFDDYEILVIDDGSNDSSLKIINSFKNENRIRIISQKNLGIIKTRNKAIKNALGEYIVQLDGDDLIGENFLKYTVPILESNSDVGIVFCQTELIGKKSGLWDRGEYSLRNQLLTNLIVITALFRKEDFHKTKGYNLDFSDGLEDWDLWLSIIELGLTAFEVKKVEFFYRILESSRNNSYSNEKMKTINRQIFINHQKLYEDSFVDPINVFYDMQKKNQLINLYKVKLNSFEHRLIDKIFQPIRRILGK